MNVFKNGDIPFWDQTFHILYENIYDYIYGEQIRIRWGT